MAETTNGSLDLIWGAAAIAALIGKTTRATFMMLERGHIPGAKKRGGQWVISRKRLNEAFGVDA